MNQGKIEDIVVPECDPKVIEKLQHILDSARDARIIAEPGEEYFFSSDGMVARRASKNIIAEAGEAAASILKSSPSLSIQHPELQLNNLEKDQACNCSRL